MFDMSLIDRLPTVKGSYRESVDLSKTNWFRVGGEAEVVFRPADVEDLTYFLREKPLDVPVFCLGVGSNVIVRDGGIPGVVIKLGREFATIISFGDRIRCGAGALDYNVAQVAQARGIAGLEFLCGVPGTMGGALAMNAGAYGSDIASIFVEARGVDEGGNIFRFEFDDMGFVYRGNTLPEGIVFTEVVLQGRFDDKEAIAARMEEIQLARGDTQPVRSRTGGSTFKNPAGMKAWELIDAAGCRGLVYGGAQVSEKHCNFLINTGDATAGDLEQLGDEVRQRVKAHSDVDLVWEIKRVGERRGGDE